MFYHCSGPNADIPYIEKIRNDRNLVEGLVDDMFITACSTCQPDPPNRITCMHVTMSLGLSGDTFILSPLAGGYDSP